MQAERSRSSRAASRLAALAAGLAGLALIALGLLVALGGNPYGWFGVGTGAAVLGLAVAGALLGTWGVPLFGGMLVLALGTLAAGAAGDADGYVLVGIGGLVTVGCVAALTHQLGRIADAITRSGRDEGA